MITLNEVVKNPSGLDSLSNYMGESDFPGVYVLMTRTRDADILTESNWDTALEALGGESENVHIYRFGHWACGWWEALCVVEGTQAFKQAEKMHAELQEYPILDEDDFSMREYQAKAEYWTFIDIGERVELCQRAGVSVFAARHEDMPQDVDMYIEV